MKIYIKIFGWLLYVVSFLVYIFLWFKAFVFISDRIGSIFAILLILLTNVLGPGLYTIWHWISDYFPLYYFLTWIGSIIVYWIGGFLIGISSEE